MFVSAIETDANMRPPEASIPSFFKFTVDMALKACLRVLT